MEPLKHSFPYASMVGQLCLVLLLFLNLVTSSTAIPLPNAANAVQGLKFMGPDATSRSSNVSLHRRQMPLQPGASPPTTGCLFNNLITDWACDYTFPGAALFQWWMSPLNGGGLYLAHVPFFWSKFGTFEDAGEAVYWGTKWLNARDISYYWWGDAAHQVW